MSTIIWSIKSFDILTNLELYAILQLRSTIFVVEQNCVYLDPDGKDEKSIHLCGWVDNQLAAYARILPPNVSYLNQSSIGRVLTNPTFRLKGLGKILMERAISETYHLFPSHTIKIGAQLYLLKFYQEQGFQPVGEEYLEDGILHIEMEHLK